MKKKISLLLSIFLSGMLFNKFINLIDLSFISILHEEQLLGNIIDFLGNVTIAITSAIIAWSFSKYQRDKVQVSRSEKKKQETISILKLLKMEIKIHNIKFENILKNNDNYRNIQEDLARLDNSVWENNYYKMEISDELMEKFYKYYIMILEVQHLAEEEIFESDMLHIRGMKEKSKNAIVKIEETINGLSG